jgi:hypothetical protein
MNALRQFVESKNGMIQIQVPDEMKNTTHFEVIILPEERETPKKKLNISSLAGKFKHISDKKMKELDNMRNEWERDI